MLDVFQLVAQTVDEELETILFHKEHDKEKYLDKVITIRYDEGRKEYVLNLDIAGFTSFEASDAVLSEAVLTLGQYLEDAGI